MIRVLIVLFLIALVGHACQNTSTEISAARKAELKDRFINPDYEMPDTLIRYELFTDSLVLTFVPKANFDIWQTTVVLRESYDRHSVINLGYLTYRNVVNDQIMIKGFHVSEDSLDLFMPDFDGWPVSNDSLYVLEKSVHLTVLRKEGSENLLEPFFKRKIEYVSFDLAFLRTLKKKEFEYCMKLVQKEVVGNYRNFESIIKNYGR